MHFRLTDWPPGLLRQATLRDNIVQLAHQLHDLGHTVAYDPTDATTGRCALLPPPAWNIIFEAFDPSAATSLIEGCRRGAQVVLIVTERPTPDAGTWNGVAKLTDRWAQYERVAPHVAAQWCWAQGSAAVLKRWNPNTIDTDLGYSPSREAATRKSLLEAGYPDDFEPPHALGFSGGLTRRRADLFRQLKDILGHEVVTPSRGEPDVRASLEADYGDVHRRTALLMQCKVILAPAAADDAPTPFSTARVFTGLHMFRPVVAEPSGPTVYGQAVKMAAARGAESFAEAIARVLADWRGHQARQFQAFKTLLSPEKTLGLAIQQTLINRRQAA